MARILLNDPYQWDKFKNKVRVLTGRFFRHKLFTEIEQGSEAKALQLATSKVIRHALNEWGQTPLVCAITYNRTNLIREFIGLGGKRKNDGAFIAASLNGNLTAIEMLLATGEDCDEPDFRTGSQYDGFTALMWATNRHHISIMKTLLAAGANVNTVSKNGTTAVMLASDGKPASLEALEVLFKYRADLTHKDWRGRNLLREAEDRKLCSGQPRMVELIRQYYPEITLP